MGIRRRVLVAVPAGLLAAGLIATPAFAHVEVTADKAQAGAGNVTLTFRGEAESNSAGILSERVVLPAGIAPGDVRLAKAPTGWKLTTGADGFTVAGPALKPGTDAEFAVRVAQLPTGAATLAFKTLETYEDGKISRWIQLPQDGQPEPDNPAPMLTLKPAAVEAATASPAAPATTSSESAASPAAANNAATRDQSAAPGPGHSDAGWWATGIFVAILMVGSIVLWRRGKKV